MSNAQLALPTSQIYHNSVVPLTPFTTPSYSSTITTTEPKPEQMMNSIASAIANVIPSSNVSHVTNSTIPIVATTHQQQIPSTHSPPKVTSSPLNTPTIPFQSVVSQPTSRKDEVSTDVSIPTPQILSSVSTNLASTRTVEARSDGITTYNKVSSVPTDSFSATKMPLSREVVMSKSLNGRPASFTVTRVGPGLTALNPISTKKRISQSATSGMGSLIQNRPVTKGPVSKASDDVSNTPILSSSDGKSPSSAFTALQIKEMLSTDTISLNAPRPWDTDSGVGYKDNGTSTFDVGGREKYLKETNSTGTSFMSRSTNTNLDGAATVADSGDTSLFGRVRNILLGSTLGVFALPQSSTSDSQLSSESAQPPPLESTSSPNIVNSHDQSVSNSVAVNDSTSIDDDEWIETDDFFENKNW